MTTQRHHFAAPLGATITTVLSMALVLVLVGAMVIMGAIASRLVQRVQECAAVNLSIANNVMPSQLDSLNATIVAMPQVSRTHVVSRNEALQQWKQETGEDLVALLGENPLNASIEVAVRSPWASPDSLLAVKQELEQLPGIIDAATSNRNVENIIDNAHKLMATLAIAVAVMLVIAMALITSMVRLLTYSQRFYIHTMMLVGASRWFVVRPYMWRGIAMGLTAALLATAIIAGALLAMTSARDPLTLMLAHSTGWNDVALSSALMVIMGIVVGGAAAALAARRYTRLTHDELYN